jgi:outer membrane protein assembly factor BamB
MRWFSVCVAILIGASNGLCAELIRSTQPDWPQFRGPKRDGISDEKGLLRAWPAGGPKLVWKSGNLGRGFSAPIVVKDRIYITGDVGNELHIFALDLAGKLTWTATNGAAWKEQYPGARSSVTFSDGRVYHENAHGVVSAFEAATGKAQWSVDLLKKFHGENITWGLSECLLVDERAVYATVGGRDASMVALDKKSGEVIWKSASLSESASYVSPILVKSGDQRLIVGCSLRNLFCVDAANGKIQWTRPMPTAYSVLALPPALVGDAVFMTAPHGKGGKLFDLENGQEIWTTPLDTCQGGVILHEGKLLGAFYPGRKGWAAVDAKTGSVLYQQADWVKGCAAFADGRLYALSEDGWMRLIEPTATEFKLHGEFRVAQAAGEAWAHPVILNGRLYVRYHEHLFSYDVKAR